MDCVSATMSLARWPGISAAFTPAREDRCFSSKGRSPLADDETRV